MDLVEQLREEKKGDSRKHWHHSDVPCWIWYYYLEFRWFFDRFHFKWELFLSSWNERSQPGDKNHSKWLSMSHLRLKYGKDLYRPTVTSNFRRKFSKWNNEEMKTSITMQRPVRKNTHRQRQLFHTVTYPRLIDLNKSASCDSVHMFVIIFIDHT